jgi:hypothetical protein
MNTSAKKNVLATVEFPINTSLESLAAKLGTVFDGLSFEKERTGRFDEVPAFVAQHSGMTFVLFGIPEEESGDAYVLELSAETLLPIQEFRKDVPEIVRSFLVDKQINSRGYLDYSGELVNALRSVGMADCKVIS